MGERNHGSRSLSGHSLVGNNLLRLVYMDEAGISNPKQEPFLVVAGVIVHADQKLNAIERHLERILERHIPARHRDGFVFHAYELFSGVGKVFRRGKYDLIGAIEWPLERRLKIADELADIPRRFDLPIALQWVERAEFPRTFQLPDNFTEAQKTVSAHAAAFSSCAMMVEYWMRQSASDEVCMLIVEDNNEARKVIRDLHNYHQYKNLTNSLDDDPLMLPLRKIKEDPLFQPKKPSHPLIVADFCAYVWKKILAEDKHYDRFFEPMRNKIISFDEISLQRQREKHAQRSRLFPRCQASERSL